MTTCSQPWAYGWASPQNEWTPQASLKSREERGLGLNI